MLTFKRLTWIAGIVLVLFPSIDQWLEIAALADDPANPAQIDAAKLDPVITAMVLVPSIRLLCPAPV
jgi:hypothetical protein